MIVTGASGKVFYNPKHLLNYRQHGNNQIGGNIGLSARIWRLKELFKGRFKTWNNLNFKALQSIEHVLTDENRQLLKNIITAREQSVIPRLVQLKKTGIYRQTFSRNLGLVVAALFKKI